MAECLGVIGQKYLSILVNWALTALFKGTLNPLL
jgi:hypothetical protein